MKKLLAKLCSLLLCAAALCPIPAFAAETAESPAPLASVRVWGSVTRLESGSLLLQNSNESDANHEIVIRLSEETFVVDAVSGLPMDPSTIRDGETVYAWAGPAQTLSLPPQASASVVVSHIPAGFGVPLYYEVAAVKSQALTAIGPVPAPTQVDLTATDGTSLKITDQAELTPYLTRNIVRLEDLVPGSRLLVWRNASDTVSRILVFPYDYQGYMAWTEVGAVSLDGQPLTASACFIGAQAYLPLRAVAEAAGYTVSWDRGKGAVVTDGSEAVLSVRPDTNTVQTPSGDRGLTAPCLIASGITYLPAGDLADLLDLFVVS